MIETKGSFFNIAYLDSTTIVIVSYRCEIFLMSTAKPASAKVYYQGHYWNDLPEVQEYLCQNFTDNKEVWWTQDIKDRFAPGKKQFKKGLFLCDGNGWVSREFIDKKIVSEAVAFDWSTDLLKEAEAKKGKRNICYFQADVNTINFENDEFDLIVNNAALHHVQYLNRLLYILSKALQPDGIFISSDYIGPQRNQYTRSHWDKIVRFNSTLPEVIRHENLHYPHLPTMLYTDSTEAIHADLIIKTMMRYFDLFEQHDTNGGLAYHLLTHNAKAFAIPAVVRKPLVKMILEADRKLTKEKKVPVLFSYFIARPKKKPLAEELVDKYQAEEDSREKMAGYFFGTYFFQDFLKIVRHRGIKAFFLSELKQLAFQLLKKK